MITEVKYRRTKPLTTDQRQNLLRDFNAGVSMKDICAKYNRHFTSVYRVLSEIKNGKL